MGAMFKLKHLEQFIDVSVPPAVAVPCTANLLQAVDDLNLRLGIVHGSVSVYNLYIDPDTDEIQLRTFSQASKLG
jgi:RIO-like serine/threonine protein kinase